MIARPWAFWRRVQYGSGFSILILMLLYWGYSAFLYSSPSCMDGRQNADERGIDCGGGCQLVCLADTTPLRVNWARSFRVTEGQYNAVAYVENPNKAAAAQDVRYTFSLYDEDGLITEKTGTSFLPPDSVYPLFEGRITTGGRVPTKTFLEVTSIGAWRPSTAGRDQFSVVSRELLSADTRPKLNAVLKNNTLNVLDNVEVVATIFDARGNALTSSRTFLETFTPRATEAAVFTWPEPIAKTIRSCEVPTDIVVAIDLSGSMNNDGDNPPEPVSSVLAAASNFVEKLKEKDQASLVTFATEAKIVQAFSAADEIANKIKSLKIAPEEETGSTNTGDAFSKATELFAGDGKNLNARKVMVILTDGLATAPDEDPEQYAISQSDLLKSSGAEVYVIGLGQQVNMDFVKRISSEGRAYQALSKSQVDNIYNEISGSICEDGAAIIDIIPKQSR